VTPDIVDWQQPPRRHRRLFFIVLAILAIVIFSSRTALSYYVDALWFGSLGDRDGRPYTAFTSRDPTALADVGSRTSSRGSKQ
jgi:hypothetical protein